MKSISVGVALFLLISFPSLGPKAESASSLHPTAALVGTWQVLDLAEAGFSPDEAQSIEYMMIQFGADGTYRRLILGRAANDTDDSTSQVEHDLKEGSFVWANDTVYVHWFDPSMGDDYLGLAQFRGDTLVYSHLPFNGQSVKMTRVPDSADFQFRTLVPNLAVPDSLIDQLKQYVGAKPCYSLVRQIYRILLPDSILDVSDSGFLRVIVTDLDADSTTEIVTLISTRDDGGEYFLLVVKRLSSGWRIIYDPELYFWYEDPELVLLDGTGPNKTFYTYELTIRGSGIHRELFKFYKLVDGSVYNCLSTARENHILGWGRYLNQSVKAELIPQRASDLITMQYNYKFFPGAVLDSDPAFWSHEDIPFVEGRQQLDYKWSSKSRTYLPLFPSDGNGLTAERLSCLNDFAEDQLFVEAFQPDLMESVRNGPKLKSDLIRQYIKLVQENGYAEPPSGPLEKKDEAGDMSFFGPKKK
jgi:hypothetical protein